MLQAIAKVFSTFGPAIFVPIVIFIVALAAGVKTKPAISAALSAGVGLTGFNMVVGAFTPVISPVINQMVKDAGVNLRILDIGWQSTSIVGYSSQMGLLYFGIAIILQLFIFFVRWTDVFMVGDLWNNYTYMVWGSILYVITKNVWLSLGLMVTQTFYTALFSEMMEKRYSTYYNYPNCALVSPHNLEGLPFAILMNYLLNKLHLYKIKLDPKSLKEKFGIIGEPMFLGVFVGLLIGIIGNINKLGTLDAWGQILKVAITTSAVMVVYPKIAGIFAGAFAPLTQAFNQKAKGSSKKPRQWYLGVNPAVSYGESATLITGILCIPLLLGISFILPGNQTLPMVDLITLPSMCIVFATVTNGNVLKSLISAIIWFTLGLLMCTTVAPYYTVVAQGVGVSIPATAVMICSYVILAKPFSGMLFFAFLSKNPVIIAAVVIVYFVSTYFFKKHKIQFHEFMEKQALIG